MAARGIFIRVIATIALFQLTGCGYGIRGNRSVALEKEGIHRIYVSSIVNNTYRYGVENVIFNALIRSFAAFKGFELVSDPAKADALLSGSIEVADSTINATTPATSLNPRSLAPTAQFGAIYVAAEYRATLNCRFSLIRRNPKPGESATIWGGEFSRSKPYPATNQLGSLGTTSPLINDSEFDRTVLDIATSMAQDVREAMVARF